MMVLVLVYGSYTQVPKFGCKLVTLFGGYSYDGVSAGIWVIHTGPKSGCKPLTLFGGYSYDGACACIWVIHTGPKSGCKLVTLFGSYSYDSLLVYTQVPNLGANW